MTIPYKNSSQDRGQHAHPVERLSHSISKEWIATRWDHERTLSPELC